MAQGTAVAESRRVGDAELVTVGIDVSDRYSHLCILGDDGEIVREERVRTTTAALTRALGGMTGARVVLEVGPRSPWLSRMLSELGHDVIVANPRQVALIARSQRKTDRSDAEHLARLGRFDPRLLFPIRHRGARAQADLQVLRSRDALVRARTALINHVRGAVKAWGAALPSCTTPAFHHAVTEHIPEELRPALLPVLRQIEQLTGEIAPGRQEDRRAVRALRGDRRAAADRGRRPDHLAHLHPHHRGPDPLPEEQGDRSLPRTGAAEPAIPVTGSLNCGSRKKGTWRCAGC